MGGDGGGVVMGADSRTSTGSYVANRVSDKITPVCNNVAVCRSGSAADTQARTHCGRVGQVQQGLGMDHPSGWWSRRAALLSRRLGIWLHLRLLWCQLSAGHDTS